MSWPKKPDGTVDWEIVFTDPDTGFIPMVENARTIESLHSCADVIVDSLFTRKDDEEYRKAYTEALLQIFSSLGGEENTGTIRRRIITMLHSIKENRIQRAIEAGPRPGEGRERRAGGDSPLSALDGIG